MNPTTYTLDQTDILGVLFLGVFIGIALMFVATIMNGLHQSNRRRDESVKRWLEKRKSVDAIATPKAWKARA